MRKLILAALLALAPSLAAAQFAVVAPTPAATDNGDRIATTAWVNNFIGLGLPLASGKIFIGSAGNIATAQTPSGDCVISLSGVVTCTKTNGVAFATLATKASPVCSDLTNASAFCSGTDAAGLTGTVASARIAGSYTGITGVGTLAAGVWNGTTIAVANGGTNCAVASGTCLDNITGFAAVGIVSRAGAGSYNARTITGTASQITVTNGDGVSGNPTLSLTNGSPVAKVKVQKFTANGTYTPSTGIINATIECIGGGGGGGSASGTAGQYFGGGGGGSGGYSRVYVTAATIGASQTVTVGGGGNGGASGSNNGVTGSNTSVGTLCVSNGGVGGMFGSGAQSGAGGAGGAAGTGDVAGTGGVGGAGLYANSLNAAFPSGNGASSAFGGGAVGLATGSGTCAAGNNAGNYGGGGSGAICNNVGATSAAGGNGSTGIVVVTEFTNQ